MSDAYVSPPVTAPVWDIPLRIFHWSLLAATSFAAVTGFLLPLNWLNVHLAAGIAIAALLLFRTVWGFTGSTFSRFSSFIFSPRETAAFIRGLLRRKPDHYAGHNPLGAIMIFALLLCLIALIATGTLALGGAEKQGPLKAFLSYSAGSASLELHELAAYALLGLVVLHVAGVTVESIRSGENLPRAMITGRKRAAALISRPRSSMAAAFFGLLAATFAISGLALSRIGPEAQPPAILDESYVKECGGCHIPFHPSLRSSAAWRQIMSGLDDHFGEDASLDAKLANTLEHQTVRLNRSWFTNQSEGDSRFAEVICHAASIVERSSCSSC